MKTVGPPPDYEQGFGRITFAKALPLPGIYNFKLFVEDLVSISEDSEIKYIVDVKNTGFPVT